MSIALVQEEPRGPSQLIEVPVGTNGLNRVNLPDIQQLRSTQTENIILKGMRLVIASVLTNGIISGTVNAANTELAKIALVLYCEGWEKMQYMPLFTMNDMFDPGGTAPHNFNPTRFNNWRKVDWTKSYLQYANGTVSVGAPYVVMFDVLYEKLDANNMVIVGPS